LSHKLFVYSSVLHQRGLERRQPRSKTPMTIGILAKSNFWMQDC
jgi:hypothetical protein